MTKIKKSELLNALKFIEENSNDEYILVDELQVKLTLSCSDKQEKILKIELYDSERGAICPQVTKTETMHW